MPAERLLVFDANALIHRAYHALPPLTSARGEMVNALYGFLLVFFRSIKEFHPSSMVAAFDMAAPTKRLEKFAAYKATRVRGEDELYAQIPYVKQALESFGVPWFECVGYEADDIIGAISEKAAFLKNLETVIVTGDLDALQLVGDRTKVYTLRRGIQDSVLYDTETVKKRFGGLDPGQLRDYKGLAGDASDNIPGVKGIGEKGAIQLLNDFGSLEGVYAAVEKEDVRIPKRQLAALNSHKKEALLSRELATIEKEIPTAFQIEDFQWKFSPEKAESFLARYGFRQLQTRIPELNGEAAGKKEKETAYAKIERFSEEGILSPQLSELEKELVPVMQDMEKAGMRVDTPYFKKLEKEMAEDLADLEKNIQKLAGREFNVASPRQLAALLFEVLGISPKGIKKTPGGVLSTASPELEKIKHAHPIVREVLLWREISKIYTTYVLPLPALADEQGRVHTSFDQLGTATGRISSSSPNLQNIPIQGVWGPKIRKGFIAEPGSMLAAFDYSQMELRIAAHLTGDPTMQEAFLRNEDIHAVTAAEVFGIPLGEVTKELRSRAKALNFGILYGMGARGFAAASGISHEEAEAFMAGYLARFSGIRSYVEETIQFAQEHGYVETLWGRKRYLPDIRSRTPHVRAQAERMAINHPVQGSAADILKKAMVAIAQEIASDDCRLLLQIHDELLFEIRDGMLAEKAPKIQSIMQNAITLSVPLRVDVKTGPNWGTLNQFL
ncbi:MAG: DNA polymerase [Candidatus Yanofskybacteria bacterium]|nr:DNA polymerase [Candidatus Yanofskybacteria bacterium]